MKEEKYIPLETTIYAMTPWRKEIYNIVCEKLEKAIKKKDRLEELKLKAAYELVEKQMESTSTHNKEEAENLKRMKQTVLDSLNWTISDDYKTKFNEFIEIVDKEISIKEKRSEDAEEFQVIFKKQKEKIPDLNEKEKKSLDKIK